MLKQLLDTDDKDRAFLQVKPPVVLMVNNLGGVSVLELGAITAVVGRQLASGYNIQPVRVLSGTYMTSLNSMGFSITLLSLDTRNSHHLLELLDAPAQAVGWSAPIKPEAWRAAEAAVPNNYETDEDEPKMRKRSRIENAADVGTYDTAKATNTLMSGLRRLIKAEPEITRYDTIVGDGDCGIGLKRGAEGKLSSLYMCPGADCFCSCFAPRSGPASSWERRVGFDYYFTNNRDFNGWDFRSSLFNLPQRPSTRLSEQRARSSNT
jgi:dihydroxyacetone kinase